MKIKTQFYFETKDGQWAHLPQAYAVIEASEDHIVDQCLKAKGLDDLPPIIERVVSHEAGDLLHALEKSGNNYTGNFGFEMSVLGKWEGFKLKLSSLVS